MLFLLSLANAVLEAEAAQRAALALKSVLGYAGDYLVALTGLIADVFNGERTAAQMGAGHRALLKEYAEATYLEGMREATPTGDPAPELEAEDEETIAQWLTGQRAHVTQFALDAYAVYLQGRRVQRTDSEADKEAWASAQQGIYNRAELWRSDLEALGDLGRASVKRKVMGTWKLGRTEKHCSTCLWLDGQRHRVSWFVSNGYIPGENGSKTLDCGGWACDCDVVDDNGKKIL